MRPQRLWSEFFLVYQSSNAVNESPHIEIDEQTNVLVAQFQIGQQLRMMKWQNSFNSFYFDDDSILHKLWPRG